VLLRRPLTVVFVVAVILRISVQFAFDAYAHPGTWEYEDIANSLLAGYGYTSTVGQIPYVAAVSSPLYVLLTVGIYLLTDHSQSVVLVLQAVAGGLTAVLAGWLGARAFRPEAAWVAGGLVAIDPGLLVYSAELHPLSFDALAFLAVICLSVALPFHPRVRSAALVGLSLGIAALTRTTILSLTPILLLWANRYRGMRLLSWSAAALVGVAVLVYSPWPVRNSLLLGQFVPGSSESTEWLWRGTNPNATGASLTPEGQTMLSVAPPDFQARIASANEAQRIAVYRDAAYQYIEQHPLDAARLFAVKLKAFWWGSDATGLLYPAPWTTLYEAWYIAVLVFAAIGLWCTWGSERGRSIAVLIVASLILVAVSQAIFYVEGRHRLAVEPLVLVLAGIGLTQIAALTYLPHLETQRLRRARDNLT
jgi:4-amino-4-deoxy-L-arabinose transferase-like glycosyltransferase